MSQERSEAVVLRSVDFSETSRIVTFLAPVRGRISCLVKGARRAKSPYASALDTLNRLEIVYYWKDSRSVQQLGEASVLNRYTGIKASLEKSAYSSVAAEIVLHVAHENEPSEPLFQTLVRGLDSLDRWTGDAQAHACWQMVQLLVAAGFEPALGDCAECGEPVGDAPGFVFRGGVTCGRCGYDRRLSPEDYTRLVALARNPAECPAVAGAETVWRLLQRYAMRQLEADLRSCRVIDEMFGKKY